MVFNGSTVQSQLFLHIREIAIRDPQILVGSF